MKALFLTYEYPPQKGGIASYLAALAEMKPDEVELEVVVPKEHWIKTVFKLLQRELKRDDRDDVIVTSHVLPLGYACFKAKFLFGVPYVVICHGTDILCASHSFWKRLMMRLTLWGADMVITNSQFTAQLLEKEHIKDVEIVYPSVRPAPQAISHRQQANILSVGRLVPRKGFDTMIRALPEILAKVPDATYTIVGSGDDLERLKKIAAETKVEDKVRFETGADDERKHALYDEAAVFALPARQEGNDVEGFGIVTVEAASHGLPVVVGRSGGSSEAVVDEETGIIVEPDGTTKLAEAVIKLLTDKELAGKMGKEAVDFAKNFAPTETAKKFWSLIKKIP